MTWRTSTCCKKSRARSGSLCEPTDCRGGLVVQPVNAAGCLHPRRPRRTGNWCFFCRRSLPLFARSMVRVVIFSVAYRQFDCGCCAETATSLATGDQTLSEWEEERQKSRAEELSSRSLLGRSSPQSMRRFLWPCDSTDGCAHSSTAMLWGSILLNSSMSSGFLSSRHRNPGGT